MTTLVWDQVGEREFETGIDHGVLYIPTAGVYSNGVAWNGLTGVTESPSGAEATPLYADNIKYLNMTSAEQFGATLECYTYPDEFAQFDGQATPHPGVSIGQQARKGFGLSYRTRLGNDIDGQSSLLEESQRAVANAESEAAAAKASPIQMVAVWKRAESLPALRTRAAPMWPRAMAANLTSITATSLVAS